MWFMIDNIEARGKNWMRYSAGGVNPREGSYGLGSEVQEFLGQESGTI